MNIRIDASVKHIKRPNLNEGGWFDVVDVNARNKTALCVFEDEFGHPQQAVFSFDELKMNPIQKPTRPSIYEWNYEEIIQY